PYSATIARTRSSSSTWSFTGQSLRFQGAPSAWKKRVATPVLALMASAYLPAPVYTRHLGLRAWRTAWGTSTGLSAAAWAAVALGLLALAGVATALLLSRSSAAPSPQFLNAPVPTTSSSRATVSP